MTRIAFINEDVFFRCGVASLIATAKTHGHKCEIFLAKAEENLSGAVKAFQPDLLAFSCTSGEHNWVVSTAASLKQATKARVIVGGPHPTFFPNIIQEAPVDIACVGEGEFALLDLLDKLENGQDITKIDNLIMKDENGIHENPVRPLIEDLDSLPFMDRDCYNKYRAIREDSVIHILNERGCPYNCTYCYNAETKKLYQGKGKYVRQRSPGSMIKEIRQLTVMYPKANVIRFYDDIFINNTKRLFEFLHLYKAEVKIPFICNVTANLITDEIVKRLKEGGCTRICVGLESGNEKMRNFLLNKKITNEQLLRTAKLCHKYNLRLSTLNMIGLPGETVADAVETIQLNSRMKPETAIIGIFQPYPGTALAEYAKEKGILDKDYGVKSMTPYFFYSSVLKQDNMRELINLQLFFWFLVKFPVFIPLIKPMLKLPPTRFHYFFFSLPVLNRKLKFGNYTLYDKIRLLIRRFWRLVVFADAGLEEMGI
jgi:anaerobic magnesium-protoporphyrin IX monomethyl ester cyclase